MTDPLDPYRQQWMADNPFPVMIFDGEVKRETTQAEYDAMVEDRAPIYQWSDQQQIALQAAREAQDQVLQAQPTLDAYGEVLQAAGAPPVAEVSVDPLAGAPPVVGLKETQLMVGETMTLLSGLITALEQQGVLRPGSVTPPQP